MRGARGYHRFAAWVHANTMNLLRFLVLIGCSLACLVILMFMVVEERCGRMARRLGFDA